MNPSTEETPPHTANSSTHNTSNFLKHLERQKNILCSIGSADLSIINSASLLEEFLFTPNHRPEITKDNTPDPKLNFYPPFLIPECLALHYPFFLTTPIPRSCKINRIGTHTYEQWEQLKRIPSKFPDPQNTKWDDGIGNVDLSAELKPEHKLAFLTNDTSRSNWFKSKAVHLTTWAYPSLNLPPCIQKMLQETFVGKPQDPNKLDEIYDIAVTDKLLADLGVNASDFRTRRETACIAATYGILLTCLEKFFCTPRFIKNCQESLHYTFGHGFVKLINIITDVTLSDYVTYHGLTHKNRLNNPRQHTQLPSEDRFDYLIDTIYLFLVFTWQTAMDIWAQTLDEQTQQNLRNKLETVLPEVLKLPSTFEMSAKLADTLFPPILLEALTSSLPDFINQAQITNFRTFICTKSGIPQSMCPALPSDFVPISYNESHPLLWCHTFVLRLSAYLLNHGDYMTVPTNPYLVSECYCNCNLCSPHKMPCFNQYLLNEILTIDNFEIQGPPDEHGHPTKRITLTANKFANAYLASFKENDYFFDEVKHYKDNKHAFSEKVEACLIKDEKLLALLRETQLRREKELLKRGTGIYLDPVTGEPLTREHHYDEVDGAQEVPTDRKEFSDALPPAGRIKRRDTGYPHYEFRPHDSEPTIRKCGLSCRPKLPSKQSKQGLRTITLEESNTETETDC